MYMRHVQQPASRVGCHLCAKPFVHARIAWVRGRWRGGGGWRCAVWAGLQVLRVGVEGLIGTLCLMRGWAMRT
jgi:hypothetical protein